MRTSVLLEIIRCRLQRLGTQLRKLRFHVGNAGLPNKLVRGILGTAVGQLVRALEPPLVGGSFLALRVAVDVIVERVELRQVLNEATHSRLVVTCEGGVLE